MPDTLERMAKEKQDAIPQVGERKRVVRSNRWDADLLDAIGDYIDAQDAPPSELSVMESAVKEFLARREFWPRKAKSKKNGH